MADRLLESNHVLVQSLQENTHNKDTSKSTNTRLKVWKFWDLKDKFLKIDVPEVLNKIRGVLRNSSQERREDYEPIAIL